MKSLVFSCFLLFLVSELHAKASFFIKGKVLSEKQFYIRTHDFSFKVEPDKNGDFEMELKTEALPTYISVFYISKSNKRESLAPLIWIALESNNPTLEITDDTIKLSRKSEMQKLSERIENSEKKERIEIIQYNTSHIPALYFLDKEKENIDQEELARILEQIPAQNQSHFYAKRTNAYYAAIQREKTKKGSTLENFSLKDETGERHEMMALKNKTKIIAILSSGCDYSLASLSLLEQVSQYGNDKIEIISIWAEQSGTPWKMDERKQKEKIAWTNLWDQYSFAYHYLRVKAYPTFLIVNPEGTILDKFTGFSKRTAKKLGAVVKEY
ncbi:hypothetical protein [Marivirga sp.]|uniref:TlpA family protein disulfide reductase n=1 Tax=Marivirga sp. TaxID=2018662 RepID=UPI002D7EB33F|nr:hypothetical protein [Marivirga sp.]HET8858899.1 hypothetical protein [Marivirga sp.]